MSSAVQWCLFWSELCLPSSEWASWVQAVMAGGAILAAVGTVVWQVGFARQQHQYEEVRRLQILWMLVYHCRVEMEFVASSEDIRAAEPRSLEFNISALRTVPLLDIVTAEAAIAVATAIEAYAAFCDERDGGRMGRGLRLGGGDFLKSQVRAAVANFKFAEEKLRMTLRDRGARLPPGAAYSINGRAYPPLEIASAVKDISPTA